MNENLPVSTAAEPHLRRKFGKRRKKAAAIIISALLLLSLAGALIMGKDTLSAWLFRRTESDVTEPPQSAADVYSYDKSAVPAGYTAIVPADITKDGYDVSAEKPAFGSGVVLVIAAHSYEAYLGEEALYVGEDYSPAGGNFTTARLAEYLASKLRTLGVEAVYLDIGTTSARAAYSEAAKKTAEFMREHDVLCVIDVHRAALTDSDGDIIRPIAPTDGGTTAQTALVAARGAEGFDTRASNAAYLAGAMNELCPGAATVKFSDGALGQNADAVFFTAEIGACGNFYGEAVRGASLLAEVLANMIK